MIFKDFEIHATPFIGCKSVLNYYDLQDVIV
jgi:hypothetical protein